MEHYAAERKKELLPFTTAWIDLESIMLSEISQVVKDKYHVISPISGTLQTKQTMEKNRTRVMTRRGIQGKKGEGSSQGTTMTHGHGQQGGNY